MRPKARAAADPGASPNGDNLAVLPSIGILHILSVREGLLALLADGPRNGHQLKVEFEAATAGVWPLNVGQVYTTLDRLDRDGLVVRSAGAGDEWTGGKRYELTAAGREALAAWWELVPADEPPPRDELMLKVLFAATLGVERAVAVLTEQRTALRRAPAAAPPRAARRDIGRRRRDDGARRVGRARRGRSALAGSV